MTAMSPLMQLRLFKNKTFSLANSVCLISYLVQQLITYLMPFYLINMLLLSSSTSGLIMLASPILMMIFSPVGGSMADVKGTKLPASIGLILICIGCLIMGLFGGTMLFAVAMIALLLVGAGNGFSVSSINTAIIDAAPIEHVGIASGMLATMRNFGQTLGVLFGTLLLTLRQPIYKAFSEQNAYLFAQRDTFYFGLLVVIVALVLVLLLPKKTVLRKG
jgi:MFS family permease